MSFSVQCNDSFMLNTFMQYPRNTRFKKLAMQVEMLCRHIMFLVRPWGDIFGTVKFLKQSVQFWEWIPLPLTIWDEKVFGPLLIIPHLSLNSWRFPAIPNYNGAPSPLFLFSTMINQVQIYQINVAGPCEVTDVWSVTIVTLTRVVVNGPDMKTFKRTKDRLLWINMMITSQIICFDTILILFLNLSASGIIWYYKSVPKFTQIISIFTQKGIQHQW